MVSVSGRTAGSYTPPSNDYAGNRCCSTRQSDKPCGTTALLHVLVSSCYQYKCEHGSNQHAPAETLRIK
jgi:hypothetical protein